MSVIMRLFTLLCLFSIATVSNASFEGESLDVTPLIGYRFGGDFKWVNEKGITTSQFISIKEDINYGILIAWHFDRKRQGEFLLNHYKTQFSQNIGSTVSRNNLALTYAHIGGNVPISNGLIPLYVTGGLGLTHIAPEDVLLDNETRFSINIGLATKIPLTESLSFRFGGRIYATFFNSDSYIFCNKDNCAISISSDLWIQSEINAGIMFSF